MMKAAGSSNRTPAAVSYRHLITHWRAVYLPFSSFESWLFEIGRASCRERVCILLGVCSQAEDGIRDRNVTGVQTCALPIFLPSLFDLHSVQLFTHKSPSSL